MYTVKRESFDEYYFSKYYRRILTIERAVMIDLLTEEIKVYSLILE
jgi:hypothetical protein